MAQLSTKDIKTSHARIHVQESRPPTSTSKPAILLIHGNSFCLKVWKHIFASGLASTHHIIAIDLPGHGSSSDAFEPEKSYNQPAYAEAAIEVLAALDVKQVVVLGWSLGGHIAIEMIPRFPNNGLKGIMIVGTPPVGAGDIEKGFTLGPGGAKASWAGRDDLTEEETSAFAHACADPPYADWMLDCVTRTDPRARKIMFEAFEGHVTAFSQRACVGETKVPVAVVNGKDELYINLAFVREVEYSSLWRGKCFEMEGCLHAPFWAKPAEFDAILADFVADVEKT